MTCASVPAARVSCHSGSSPWVQGPRRGRRQRVEGTTVTPIDGATRLWTVPVNVAATVAWRLPGALMGVVLVVVAGSMLGPPGFLLAVLWLSPAWSPCPGSGSGC